MNRAAARQSRAQWGLCVHLGLRVQRRRPPPDRQLRRRRRIAGRVAAGDRADGHDLDAPADPQCRCVTRRGRAHRPEAATPGRDRAPPARCGRDPGGDRGAEGVVHGAPRISTGRPPGSSPGGRIFCRDDREGPRGVEQGAPVRAPVDRHVVARPRVDGQPADIVGVLPPSFNFPRSNAAVLLPMPMQPVNDVSFDFQAIGRLKPGLSMEDANADVARIRASELSSMTAA